MTYVFRTALLIAALALAAPLAAAAQPDGQTPAAPTAAKPADDPAKTGGLIAPPPPGKGQVVFYRPSRIGGMAMSFTVKENGADVAKLRNGSYYVLVANPGPHRFQLDSEVTDTTNVEVETGETQYLEETIGVGIVMAHPHLIPSDQAKFDSFRPGSMKLAKVKDPAAN